MNRLKYIGAAALIALAIVPALANAASSCTGGETDTGTIGIPGAPGAQQGMFAFYVRATGDQSAPLDIWKETNNQAGLQRTALTCGDSQFGAKDTKLQTPLA